MIAIPAAFAQTSLALHRERGTAWLQYLPTLLAEYAQCWAIQLGSPFSLFYHYVAPAPRGAGSAVVLKAGYPSRAFVNENESPLLLHWKYSIDIGAQLAKIR